jgi:hypothetical protein
MSWSPGGEVQKATIDDLDGNQVEFEDLDLIWWRRLTGEPRLPDSLGDEARPAASSHGIAERLFRIVLTS